MSLRQFFTLSEVKAPFWMIRLILQGLHFFLCLIIVVACLCAMFEVRDYMEWQIALVVLIPAAICLLYTFPQWVAIIVGTGHRGVPPVLAVVLDSIMATMSLGVSVFLGVSKHFSRSFEYDGDGNPYARTAVVGTPLSAVVSLVLVAIGAYDIIYLRKQHVYKAPDLVTGYQSANDLTPQTFGPINVRPVSPPMVDTRSYTRSDRRLTANDSRVLNNQTYGSAV